MFSYFPNGIRDCKPSKKISIESLVKEIKNNDTPAKKILQTSSGKNDLYVFMKGELSGGKITYSISNNGINYEVCGTAQMGQQGLIHLSLQGSYLIDSYAVEY